MFSAVVDDRKVIQPQISAPVTTHGITYFHSTPVPSLTLPCPV